MPHQIKPIDLRDLPEDAQREVYDFYLFVKQRALLSEKSLAEDWNKPEEDEAWKAFQ